MNENQGCGAKPLELWGGPECTINRVHDTFIDQFALSGHDDRADDVDRFAALGLSAIRYPLSWERVAATGSEPYDWTWTRSRLDRLRARGIRVIAGLVHHGSGPRHTDLLDPDFAPKLTAYAASAAAAFDWIEDWTPVNEPVTTARFAALYGHWYPHRRDERSFWLALVNQIDATRLAMQAIRRVNPRARLIQTDDLGHTFATAALSDQAAFDNQRRWAGWDLLCGRVVPGHAMWDRLEGFGLGERLRALADAPCPPDVIGVNHYLTSDRFLDHRIERYPPGMQGEAGGRTYVDVEAIRVLDPPPEGLAGAILEAWARYHIPIAMTEVHNGSTRDEQMRWLAQAWDTAGALRGEGIAIEAVTCWALLGSQGWNTLLTAPGLYEAGAYDVSGAQPRPTALARLASGLATGAERHPVLGGAGWWQRPIRLLHPVAAHPAKVREHARVPAIRVPGRVPPLLICGASGTLGQAVARACEHRDIAYVLSSRAQLDVSDAASIDAALDRWAPWAVVNATGWVRVDEAEAQPEACHAVNAAGAALLAERCAARNIATTSFSSDLVFDGRRDGPYLEHDAPNPLNVYGASKAAMERAIAALSGVHLIVRTAAFFSPSDPHNFAQAVVATLSGGAPFHAAMDQVVTPSYVPLLVDRTLDLVIDGESGLWHLAGEDAVSWSDFARRVARACGLDEGLVRPVRSDALGQCAVRAARCPLGSTRGASLGRLDDALARFAAGRHRSLEQAAAA